MKGKKEMIIMVTAMLAFTIDVMALAVQVQTIPCQFLRFYYIPVFLFFLYSNAREDMQKQKEMIRNDIQQSRNSSEQRFLEEYAKFVSEVHK